MDCTDCYAKACATFLDSTVPCAVTVLLLAAIMAAASCTRAAASPSAPYPKVNLAVGYEVDANWPKRPAAFQWRYMTSVALDSKEQVWLLGALDPQVQVYGGDGTFVSGWGEGRFMNPHHITVDHEDNVWITDFGRHVVEKFTPEGDLLLTLGTVDEAGEDATHFNRPTAAVVSPAGDIFVTDGYSNNRVAHFNAAGEFVKTWGKLGVGAGELSQPHAIALDSQGRVYVGERNNCRIQIFDQEGNSLAQWRNLVNPWGIWITPDDEVYVCGSSPKRWGAHSNLGNPPTDQLVMKLDTTGRVLELWTFPLAEEGKLIPGQIDWIHGIAVDSRGNLYLSDVADNSAAHRAQKFLRLEPQE
jgi:NHL repeat